MHGYHISINTTSKKEYDTEFSISEIVPPLNKCIIKSI